MAWADDVVRDGIGRVLRVDVSTDGFSTVAYRYGSQAGQLNPGFADWYEDRILSAPTLRRALSQNRIATSGGCTLELSNPDGGVDWLTGHDDADTIAKARFRLYLVLFDPATPSTVTARLLGEFFISGWPRQTSETVTVQLGDAMLAPLSMGAPLPSVADWSFVGTPGTNPLRAGSGNGIVSYSYPASISPYVPVQLSFGEGWHESLPALLPYNNFAGQVVVPLYTTTNSAAVSASDVTELRVLAHVGVDGSEMQTVDIPRTKSLANTSGDVVTGVDVWTVNKSPAITKAGKTFYVVYLLVYTHLGRPSELNPANLNVAGQISDPFWNYARAHGYSAEVVKWLNDAATASSFSWAPKENWPGDYVAYAGRVTRWFFRGSSLSARTTSGSAQHAVDVVRDLVEHYAPTGLTVNTTTAGRVKAGTPVARVAGEAYRWQTYDATRPAPSLRQIITAIAQSSDIDVFVDWDGKVSFSSDVWDYTTATQAGSLITLPESRLAQLEQWIPEQGERGAPFNRVMFSGARENPAEWWQSNVPFQGPFDLDFTGLAGHIQIASRVMELELRQDWKPDALTRDDPVGNRAIDGRARSRIRCVAPIEALRVDLGDYVLLDWTSNRSWPYASPAVVQVDSIVYAMGDDTVELHGTWRGDTTAARYGYLLDDESLVERTKNASGTGELDLDNGYFNITSGTTDFTAMGVLSGDVLVVRDSSEGVTGFVRNAAFLIQAVTSSTSLELPAASGVFTGIINADWYIVRGAVNYPTAALYPITYPDGGEMYGKVTNSSGDYSDTTDGNRLING